MDRTGNLSGFGPGGGEQNSHAEQSYDGFISEMVWPSKNDKDEGYASFVDKGTLRSVPYPFTPQAEDAAEKELHVAVVEVLEEIARSF